MGVFNGNYKIESLNETLDVAYGAIVKLEFVENSTWKATFAIAKTRENATHNFAYKHVSVEFEWDRKCNPIPLAYEKAKEQRNDWQYDKDGKPVKIKVDGIFTGWYDDDKNV